MGRSESLGGVRYYTKATATLTVNFPEDKIACKWCPMDIKDPNNFSRQICFLTGEILVFPEFMPGADCPLEIKEDGG